MKMPTMIAFSTDISTGLAARKWLKFGENGEMPWLSPRHPSDPTRNAIVPGRQSRVHGSLKECIRPLIHREWLPTWLTKEPGGK